jgi:hypothetical protein
MPRPIRLCLLLLGLALPTLLLGAARTGAAPGGHPAPAIQDDDKVSHTPPVLNLAI